MTLREEIHSYIDDLPESKLLAIKPILLVLVDDSVVIELYITEEERLLCEQAWEEYERNPGSFVRLEDIIKSREREVVYDT